jgi:hypothetical protein
MLGGWHLDNVTVITFSDAVLGREDVDFRALLWLEMAVV